jgi:hypothetical protein
MVDGADEMVKVLSERTPKAKKIHHCTECSRAIEPGERYLMERCVFDDEMCIYKTCSHCQIAREWLIAECGGWLYQGVHEDIEEHVREGYGFGLARLAIGMRRKWRYRGGHLMPIPKLPKITAA